MYFRPEGANAIAAAAIAATVHRAKIIALIAAASAAPSLDANIDKFTGPGNCLLRLHRRAA